VELVNLVTDCARESGFLSNGRPPEWWWDAAEGVLHDLVWGRPALPLSTGVLYCDPTPRGKAAKATRKYKHTRGRRVAPAKLERDVEWFVQRHIEGRTYRRIADEHAATGQVVDQAAVQMAYKKLCKILGVSPRSKAAG
jgi:hypothetical protein